MCHQIIKQDIHTWLNFETLFMDAVKISDLTAIANMLNLKTHKCFDCSLSIVYQSITVYFSTTNYLQNQQYYLQKQSSYF